MKKMVRWKFLSGNFPGGSLLGGIFPGGSFPDTEKKYAKNSQVYMHWHWSSSEKSSFSKPIASVFSPHQ